ncbi:olfactory receptor 6M1-like [Rhinophrynus dorsalis]
MINTLNHTTFTLVGFTLDPRMQIGVFVLLLVVYLLSLTGNMSIIIAIWLNRSLHAPMYYFLSSLALVDICFISSTVPKLLAILSSDNKRISLVDCLLQLYFYISLGTTEFYILAVMSVDRYVAICHPLRYHSIITSRMCLCLSLIAWIGGLFTFMYPFILLPGASFCGSNEINHFFCDSTVVLKIICSNTHFFEITSTILTSCVILGSFTITLASYSRILYTIMKLHSAAGRKKAFSTCTSHFIVVSLVYGSAIFIYVRPVENSSPNHNKVAALLNSVMTPLLNPFMYSLRNEQVQHVFRDVLFGPSGSSKTVSKWP